MNRAIVTSNSARALLFSLGLVIGSIYFLTLWGSQALQAKADALAFADSAHYIDLLTDHYYSQCLHGDHTCPAEYYRKAVHHYSYMVLGGLSVTAGSLVGATDLQSIWILSPLLGVINFLLAYAVLARSAPSVALPGALTLALIPSTWIYSSIPETWILSLTGALLMLWLRERRVPIGVIGVIVACFALTNFLLLLLVLLLDRPEEPLRERVIRMLKLGITAGVCWALLLSLLGWWVAPEFLPHKFLPFTRGFKDAMPENLPIYHPARWVYSGLNGWIVPFVLNQKETSFAYPALVHSARTVPLGTLAVLAAIGLIFAMLWNAWNQIRTARQTGELWTVVSGPVMYLALMYVLTTLALYYETFLYSPMIIGVLVLYAFQALLKLRHATALAWTVTVIFTASSIQQMLYFRQVLP